jgi:uncharacterized protein
LQGISRIISKQYIVKKEIIEGTRAPVEKISSESKINNIACELKTKWSNKNPIFKLFFTSTKKYVYDPGTNIICECNELEHDLLSNIITVGIDRAIDLQIIKYGREKSLDTLHSLLSAINEYGILFITEPNSFRLSDHYDNFEERINTKLKQIILEVTEKCNLRCKYCIYDTNYLYKRNHGYHEMSLSHAYSAINYLMAHSNKEVKAAISFYGGEPLLRFSFIKKCVEYVRKNFGEREVSFSITTNATLINQDIAKYLYENNFSVTLSVDGPKCIHDEYRKYANGKGSFEKTVRGIKNIIKEFGESIRGRTILSMVYTPPFSENRLNKILSLWEEIKELPKNMRVAITYPEIGSILLEKNAFEDKGLEKWAIENYINRYGKKKDINPIASGIVEPNLAKLIQRPISLKPLDRFALNGCCIPGARKIYISVNGDFRLCERINDFAPRIGNVSSGINIDMIRKIYIEEYYKRCIKNCSTCWVMKLCGLCYCAGFNGDSIDDKKKEVFCTNFRASTETYMILMSELLERNKYGLNYLKKWSIS